MAVPTRISYALDSRKPKRKRIAYTGTGVQRTYPIPTPVLLTKHSLGSRPHSSPPISPHLVPPSNSTGE